MLLAFKLKLAVAAACAVAPLAFSLPPGDGVADRVAIAPPAMTELKPGVFRYRLAGDFTRDGRPTNAPAHIISIPRPVAIMTHQVTAAEYQLCVLDHACPSTGDADADRPVVKVSWRDADGYATWLSGRSGVTYRLPTDEEWVFAAGSRFRDEVLPDGGNDPAQRWLARYDQESARAEALDRDPRPIGSFGANENGNVDLAGNVWEWTNSCFVRQALDASGATTGTPIVNCGVRVVEGRHRTHMTDFIRDARTGGCSVGTPPSNLGFRLVRENGASNGWLQALVAWLGILDSRG